MLFVPFCCSWQAAAKHYFILGLRYRQSCIQLGLDFCLHYLIYCLCSAVMYDVVQPLLNVCSHVLHGTVFCIGECYGICLGHALIIL